MTDINPHDLLIEHDELLAKLSDVLWNNGFNNAAREVDAAVERLHDFLAQPDPQVPTDEDLNTMLYYEFTTSTGHGERSDPIGFARAVLARWGRLSINPVSLSERLPGPEDCDAEGRCWYFFMDSVIGGCGWQMFNEEENQQLEPSHFWLPHYALPIPTR